MTNGCINCIYSSYDYNTGFYNCMKEDFLTEKDTDDLTETGGENCSQYKEDNCIDEDIYYMNLLHNIQA